MARNTQVAADTNAPAVTAILAKFVATHSSRGWSDAVDHEAHRTFLNWVGCAVGAANHASALAALGGVRELEPAPQAAVLGRRDRVDMASAALVNGITSHTFDFDDTHLKTILHPAGPVASAVLALAEHTGASGRALREEEKTDHGRKRLHLRGATAGAFHHVHSERRCSHFRRPTAVREMRERGFREGSGG